MSYDLVKNLKIVKTDNGFNVACNIASSNIRTYDNKHVKMILTQKNQSSINYLNYF